MNNHVYIDLLRDSISRHSGKSCFHVKRRGGWKSWTYADFGRDLNRITSALTSSGMNNGDNAVVIGENTPEWVIAYHSAILAGGCAVPVDPNLPAEEIREIVKQTEARFIFCSPLFLPLFRDIKSGFARIAEIVALDNEINCPEATFARFAEKGDPEFDAFSRTFAPDDPLAIIFTSGTTGKAKGVVLNQRNFTAVSLHAVPRMQVTARDTMIAFLPLHHVFGFAGCIAATLPTGVDIVFVPVIKGPLIVEALRERQVTILPAVPQMLELLYGNIERTVRSRGIAVRTVFGMLKGLSITLGSALGQGFRRKLFSTVHAGFGGKLRMIISGGSSLKKKFFDGFTRMGFSIVEGYGLTETFGPITICPATDPRQASVGLVLSDNEVTVSNPDGEGIGEVLFKGATVFPGYYRNDRATRAVFDEKGWFHTGDLGRMTRDGFLYLTGRIKDVIVLDSGKNVYPDELEEYFSSSTMVEEIGVLGIQQQGSERVGAVIVPSKTLRKKYPMEVIRTLIAEELRNRSRSLPSYKKISAFVICLSPLPRTSTRKIKKTELRAVYDTLVSPTGKETVDVLRCSFAEAAMMKAEEFKTVLNMVAQLSPEINWSVISPHSHLEFDCGIDSLKKIDLICMCEEHYRLAIAADAVVRIETVGDLINSVREAKSAGASDDSHALKSRIARTAAAVPVLREKGSAFYRFLPRVAAAIAGMAWGARVHASPLTKGKPLIFAANHESLVDIPLLLAALPWEIRKDTYTIGKSELTGIPILSSVFLRCNMIPVERQGDITEALAASIGFLKAGKNLLIFPEGTRTQTGAMGSFKTGIGTLLLETGAALVPIRIKGTFAAWPAGRSPRFGLKKNERPAILFGDPVTLEELRSKGAIGENAGAAEISKAIWAIIAGM
jgi:long-chain acyl-CoA synthetase